MNYKSISFIMVLDQCLIVIYHYNQWLDINLTKQKFGDD